MIVDTKKTTREKRLLMIGTFLSSTTGYPSVCEDLANHLSSAGWQVIASSTKANRFYRLGDMLRTAYRNRAQYDIAQVDVYSGSAFIWAEAVCALLRQMKKRYVLTLHGGNLPVFAKRAETRIRRLFDSAAAITVPSPYMLDQMRPYSDQLLLLPNPLNISNYDFRLRTMPAPKLMWLRAFHETYNPSLAPKVISLLSPQFPDIHLTMVGPDKGDGALQNAQKVAVELGVSEKISFPGSVPKKDVPHWLNSGDIFINTTNIDNTPISVLEAMACGLPVVSTNVGGLPYLLEHEKDALLVPPNDPQAMAEAVKQILTQPTFAEQLSRNARTKAERFDWSAILPQWESLLLSILKTQPIQVQHAS